MNHPHTADHHSDPQRQLASPGYRIPPTVPEIVAESKKCEAAGAAILHIHAEGMWPEMIQRAPRQDRPDRSVRHVEPGDPDRMEVFEHHADMISIIVSHHDEAFVGLTFHAIHSREELAEYAALSRKYGVKLELETWHTGSIWKSGI